MALISCPDCGRQVSDKAQACPACAHPIAATELAGEAAQVVRASGAPARVGAHRRARLVSVKPPEPAGIEASLSLAPPPVASVPAPERRPAATYDVVCIRCRETETLAFPRTSAHVCVSCEEAALLARMQRRAVLQWWPLVVIVLLLAAAAGGTSWAMRDAQHERDPVTPGR
ncbi:MAG: hypothetical protein JWP87_2012 [Labilithrix sp.]|nr:hypothetical protein [Labilithrix sp.]